MNQRKQIWFVCCWGSHNLKAQHQLDVINNYVLMLSNITDGDFNFLFSYLCIRLLDLCIYQIYQHSYIHLQTNTKNYKII